MRPKGQGFHVQRNHANLILPEHPNTRLIQILCHCRGLLTIGPESASPPETDPSIFAANNDMPSSSNSQKMERTTTFSHYINYNLDLEKD